VFRKNSIYSRFLDKGKIFQKTSSNGEAENASVYCTNCINFAVRKNKNNGGTDHTH
jgi:hypothetical protein